jgi:hypothetical protein
MEVPNFNKMIKPKITINKNANFATKLFESKKLLFDEFPLLVENEL